MGSFPGAYIDPRKQHNTKDLATTTDLQIGSPIKAIFNILSVKSNFLIALVLH